MQKFKGYEFQKFKGYQITDDRLSHWHALIEEWHLAIERYCRVTEKENDAPYWYNERANVGLLAGAAWRCGRVALEEFQSDKYSKSEQNRGRADLWLGDEDRDEYIEAKFKWLLLDLKNPESIAKAQIKLACRDAQRSKGSDNKLTAIGLSFLPLYIPKGKSGNLQDLLNNTIKKLQNVECGIKAWTFPEIMKDHVTEKGNICPGVFLMADIAK